MTRKWDFMPSTPSDCEFCFGVGTLPPVPGAGGWVPCPFACGRERRRSLNEVHHGGYHPQVLARDDKWCAWVDGGILSDVLLLWSHGIATWVSCEGIKDDPDMPYRWDRYVGLVGWDHDQDMLREMLPWVGVIKNDKKTSPNGVGMALYTGLTPQQ